MRDFRDALDSAQTHIAWLESKLAAAQQRIAKLSRNRSAEALTGEARNTVFQLGDFTLHAGQKSTWKIECDNFTDGDWECFAALIAARARFGSVEGIPEGGSRLARCLEKYKTSGHHLVVDDVWTDGTTKKERGHHLPETQYWVAFARGPLEPWCRALFSMEPAVDWRALSDKLGEAHNRNANRCCSLGNSDLLSSISQESEEALRAWEEAKGKDRNGGE